VARMRSRSITTTSATTRFSAVGARVPITCTVEPGLAWAWAQDDESTEETAQPSSSRAGRSLSVEDTWTFRLRTPRAALFKTRPRQRKDDSARTGSALAAGTCPRRPPQRQLPVHQAGIRACECRLIVNRSHRRLPRFITQWLHCRSHLANRCGGSAGMAGESRLPGAPASRLTSHPEREWMAPVASGQKSSAACRVASSRNDCWPASARRTASAARRRAPAHRPPPGRECHGAGRPGAVRHRSAHCLRW
jgi:hypothetical protein